MTRQPWHQVLIDDSGQGLVEYGLILGLVSVVCIVALQALGTNINTVLSNVASAV